MKTGVVSTYRKDIEMKNTNKRTRLSSADYKNFAIDLCSNKTIKDIAKKYNITTNYVDNYRYCVRALNNKKDLKNNGRWSKEIISYLKTYLIENKVEIKDKVKRRFNYDVRQFAIDICNNEDTEAMSEFYGVSLRTIQCYKNFAKAALNSEGSKIEEKIYATLSKEVKAQIKSLLQNNKYSNSLKYTWENYKPKQVGPNTHTYQRENNIKPLPVSEIVAPKLDLNNCSKKEAPVSEIIGLLQSVLNSIQDLIQKL